MANTSNNLNISNEQNNRMFTKICFVSIDIERDNFGNKNTFKGVENLESILKIFKKYNVSATLFVTGKVLEQYQNLIKKLDKNYEIACHNYLHIPLNNLDFLERKKQLEKFRKIYQNILKKAPKGFRAPRNIIDNEQFKILQKYGFVYDSSIISSHIFLHKYEGYKGRAPQKPYHPSSKDYQKKGALKILEIPNTSLLGGIPFAATWIRRLGIGFFKFLLFLKKPKFLTLTMHSWDSIRFKGKSSKNSGEAFLKQLDQLLLFLKKIGYKFRSGEQIYKNF